jgi:hypothetical protein
VATLKGEQYSFTDDDDAEVHATRYTLEGLEPDNSDPDF